MVELLRKLWWREYRAQGDSMKSADDSPSFSDIRRLLLFSIDFGEILRMTDLNMPLPSCITHRKFGGSKGS